MTDYRVFCASQMGAQHDEPGGVCEDASATYAGSLICAAAVADGVGDKKCFRSAKGSRFACSAALRAFREVEKRLAETNATGSAAGEVIFLPEGEIQKTIVANWRNLVDEDVRLNPFTEEELSIFSEERRAAMQADPARAATAYASTLLAALAGEDFWAALQLGDGLTVHIPEGSGEYTVEMDDDARMGSERAPHNMSDYQADKYFLQAFSAKRPGALCLGTDGIEKRFFHYQLELESMYYRLCTGLCARDDQGAETELAEFLFDNRARVNNDDLSMGLIVNTRTALVAPTETLLSLDAEENVLRDQCSEKHELISMREQTLKTNADWQNLAGRAEAVQRELNGMDARAQTLRSELEELRRRSERYRELTDEMEVFKKEEQQLLLALDEVRARRHAFNMSHFSRDVMCVERIPEEAEADAAQCGGDAAPAEEEAPAEEQASAEEQAPAEETAPADGQTPSDEAQDEGEA